MAAGGTADVTLTFNGAPVVGAVVYDPSNGEVVITCTVTVAESVVTECYDGVQATTQPAG